MTNGVNPINVNTQGIAGAYGFGSKPKTESEEAKEQEISAKSGEKASVPAEEVLNFMAQSAVSVTPKTIDTSKYVDEASAQRIAGFMSDFEDIVATNLSAITAEFPDMSEGAAMTLALAQVGE